MQNTSRTESFANEFVQNYMAKIFYFCLKKTGSKEEAEDLTQDISVNILRSLAHSSVPENFPAWVWQISRNRYSFWAKQKHKASESMSGVDIYEAEIPDNDSYCDNILHEEEMSLLRRELAFISSDYRNIITEYYIKGKKVNEIASFLNIPCGTVKARLFRARKILKEGMDMAREFGAKSYNPEDLGFISSGNQPSGLPFSAVQRKIPVNILIEANNNPSTVEELSIELGIAVPYMEEEVELLVKSELLKKVDSDKYITNFFISPKECQNEINDLCCDFAEKTYKNIWDIASKALDKAKELGALNGTISETDAQMYFAFYVQQKTENSVYPQNIFGKFKRADGGNWGFIGKEKGAQYRLKHTFFNNSANNHNNICVNGYQASKKHNYGKTDYKSFVPDGYLMPTMKKLVETKGDTSDFSEEEQSYLKELLDSGFIIKTDDGKMLPNMLVFCGNAKEILNEYIFSLADFGKMKEEMAELHKNIKETVSKYCTQNIKEDLDYYVAMSTSLRGIYSMLWKDKELYTGGNAYFLALYLS